MRVAAIVVAAGRGERFGGAKQFADLNGRSVAAASVAAARSVADSVVLVVPDAYRGAGEGADLLCVGGPTRSASVRAGLALCADADVVVVHDAARPLADPALFAAVVAAVDAGADGAVPGLAVTDTLKRVSRDEVAATLSRDGLVAVQTPQAFRREALARAHANGEDASDDAALVEAAGGRVVVVAGDARNVKITDAGDLARVRGAGAGVRIGQGYDVHRVSDDPSRRLVLGLVELEGAPGLAGHSDADVATHALCDALLGAAGLGDLGRHFPDTDPGIAGVSSRDLLARTVALVEAEGLRALSADVTIVAERPRLADHMALMAERLSDVAGCAVSVKATTAEGLGPIGRAEGIAATAVALVGPR
ncbi:MAG TPA: 2-C-methyl-D-erythritol 2,4-cyclodiphosphate synthase [Acidimicrobiales bacterium]|nr:2-C-methyl-D-erythritol 2,4-cyclodiphosphate synthase [Acidimicrobiales bacterium]